MYWVIRLDYNDVGLVHLNELVLADFALLVAKVQRTHSNILVHAGYAIDLIDIGRHDDLLDKVDNAEAYDGEIGLTDALAGEVRGSHRKVYKLAVELDVFEGDQFAGRIFHPMYGKLDTQLRSLGDFDILEAL